MFEIHCFKYTNIVSIVASGGIVDEVNFFTICVTSNDKLSDHLVLFTDIPIELSFIGLMDGKYWYTLSEDSIREYFKTQDFDNVFEVYKQTRYLIDIKNNIVFYMLFLNYPIGRCIISLYDKKSENIVFEKEINITSSKVDSQEFASLISFIENRGKSIWAKYSLIQHDAEGFENDDQFEWLLVFMEDFLEVFSSKYLTDFFHDKISVILSRKSVESFDASTSVSESSIVWLFENLDVLKSTVSHDLDKILINRRPFIPDEILAENLFESTDCIENQMILGFLDELQTFSQNLLYQVDLTMRKIKRETFEELIEVYALKFKSKRLREISKRISHINSYLIESIPVSKYSVDFTHLNKIEAKEHYYFVYIKFLEWLNSKDAKYSISNKYFKGITRLDQLFERATFFCLIEAFSSLGYRVENVQTSEAKKIDFIKESVTYSLFYQSLPDGLTTIKKDSSQLKPDFILDFGNKGIVIMDAKYKKSKNISKYDYPELTLKYLHGIGSKSGGVFEAKGLIVLYPEKINTIDFYHKNSFALGEKNMALPVIGSIGFNFQDSGNFKIEELIKGFLEHL